MHNVIKKGSFYIISGPYFANTDIKIGRNEVCVPTHIFKVFYSLSNENPEGIAFLVPNNADRKPLNNYKMTIRELENKIGLDFFHELPNSHENLIETKDDFDSWSKVKEIKGALKKSYKTDNLYKCGKQAYLTPKGYCYAIKDDKKKRVKSSCCL